MFVSPIVIRYGIVALEQEITRLQIIHEECGDEWPPDFDPNDIWMFDLVLKEFREYKDTGYEEECWRSKPFRFFIALISSYVDSNINELSQEDYLELHGMDSAFKNCWALFTSSQSILF